MGISGLLRKDGNGTTNGNGHAYVQHQGMREAAFLRNLRQRVGRSVEVATTCGVVEGRLVEVEPDHIVVRVNGRTHHIRLGQICWFVNGNGNGNGDH